MSSSTYVPRWFTEMVVTGEGFDSPRPLYTQVIQYNWSPASRLAFCHSSVPASWCVVPDGVCAASFNRLPVGGAPGKYSSRVHRPSMFASPVLASSTTAPISMPTSETVDHTQSSSWLPSPFAVPSGCTVTIGAETGVTSGLKTAGAGGGAGVQSTTTVPL